MNIWQMLRERLGQGDPYLDKISVLGNVNDQGQLMPTPGALRAAIEAKKKGHQAVFIAKEQQEEAAIVSGIEVYGVWTVDEIVGHLSGTLPLAPIQRDTRTLLQAAQASPSLDYADIIEDENAKHALEIAVIGHHHLILWGDPRAGKRRLAEHLPSMMPRLTPAQALAVSLRFSDTGNLPLGEGLIAFPAVQVISPFTSSTDLTEKLYLSHLGVLVLQDLEEIPDVLIQQVREVVSTKRIMWQGSSHACQPLLVGLTAKPWSPPLLSTFFDLLIEVPIIEPLDHLRFGELEPSVEIRARVEAARAVQAQRYAEVYGVSWNADLPQELIHEYVSLDQAAKLLMTVSMKKLGVDPIFTPQILRVTRSITDRLGADARMHPWHIAEAVQYLALDSQP